MKKLTVVNASEISPRAAWADDASSNVHRRVDERPGVKIVGHLFPWPLSVLLLVGLTASALDNPGQSGQSPGNPPGDSSTSPSAGATPATTTPSVTVTGKVPGSEQPLPKLAPDQFTDCYSINRTTGPETLDWVSMETCAAQLARDKRVVVEKCLNHDGKNAPAVVIQACTESLEHKIFDGGYRFYIFANRAEAYVAAGDKRRALDDYNQAVKLAPKNAKLYFNRGVFYAAQPDRNAALRDFDSALSIDPKLVSALRQRAIIYLSQKNYSGALADFSEAVRLEPKTAALWSERGYVSLLLRDFENAVADEAEAIRLDPKLARAYFLRGAAFGDLGNSPGAVSDIVTAVGLDPSLDHYVSTKGKTASIALPPL